MKIFIPRVPKNTTNSELEALVAQVLEKKFRLPFTERPGIDSCHVLEFKDADGFAEYHGLVSVFPDEAGIWLLNHFQEQRLGDRPVYVRQFMDRRHLSRGIRPEDERRRNNLKITKAFPPRHDFGVYDYPR